MVLFFLLLLLLFGGLLFLFHFKFKSLLDSRAENVAAYVFFFLKKRSLPGAAQSDGKHVASTCPAVEICQ